MKTKLCVMFSLTINLSRELKFLPTTPNNYPSIGFRCSVMIWGCFATPCMWSFDSGSHANPTNKKCCRILSSWWSVLILQNSEFYVLGFFFKLFFKDNEEERKRRRHCVPQLLRNYDPIKSRPPHPPHTPPVITHVIQTNGPHVENAHTHEHTK